jgi:hypothetical protein
VTVADQQRSRRFYERFFGFDSDGEPDGEGCLHLTDGHDFDLTLAAGPNASDPDGYRLEVFWDRSSASSNTAPASTRSSASKPSVKVE